MKLSILHININIIEQTIASGRFYTNSKCTVSESQRLDCFKFTISTVPFCALKYLGNEFESSSQAVEVESVVLRKPHNISRCYVQKFEMFLLH